MKTAKIIIGIILSIIIGGVIGFLFMVILGEEISFIASAFLIALAIFYLISGITERMDFSKAISVLAFIVAFFVQLLWLIQTNESDISLNSGYILILLPYLFPFILWTYLILIVAEKKIK